MSLFTLFLPRAFESLKCTTEHRGEVVVAVQWHATSHWELGQHWQSWGVQSWGVTAGSHPAGCNASQIYFNGLK